MDTAWVDVSTAGPSNVLESMTEPSGSRSLHLMQTDDGIMRSPGFPSRISAATVTLPLLKTPALDRNVTSSHCALSSARSGNLSQNAALAALTAPGSRLLMSAPLTMLPVQSS